MKSGAGRGGIYTAHVQVLVTAQGRIQAAKPESLTAKLYEPYAAFDVLTTMVAFDPESAVRRADCRRAHAFAPSTSRTGKTLDEAIDMCCPPGEREGVKQLKDAHVEFTRLLEELARENTQEELAEAAAALPEFFRRYKLE